MKKLKLVVIILLVLSLTGCVAKYKATDKQSDAIAEYMAGLLLESDNNYDQKLIQSDEVSAETTDHGIDQTVVTPTPSIVDQPEVTSPAEGGKPVSTGETYSLSEVIADSAFQIDYKSYKLTDQYKSEYFVLNPRDGYRLMVTTFTITNKENEQQVLNLTEAGIKYEISGKSGNSYTPLLTLLENDLQYINMKVDAGKSKTAVLIFQVPNESEVTGSILTISRVDKTAELTIQ